MAEIAIRKVAVIGLGKLGLPAAACMAAKGYSVLGVDSDLRRVELLNAQRVPIFEPGLAEKLAEAGTRFSASTDVAAAVKHAQLIFIVVPTPSESNGSFSLRYILQACDAIGRGIACRNDRPIVVVTSTVSPGSTGGPIRQAMEQSSGMRCGEEFGLCYSPEFIALGSVIRDFLNPDFILIGESDKLTGDIVEDFFAKVTDKPAPAARMAFANAELAKIAVNTYVTTKITFANMLARLCERLPDGDVDAVTGALGLDRRIGRQYLKGAIAYGGPCFPRDNMALSALASDLGVSATLPEATHNANREELQRLADIVSHHASHSESIGILGLAYKPETDVVDESPGVLLALELAERGRRVTVFDPVAMTSARRVLGTQIAFAESMDQCVRDSSVIVITTPWSGFKDAVDLLLEGTKSMVLIDCWRILNSARLPKTIRYVPVGKASQHECNLNTECKVSSNIAMPSTAGS